MNGDSGLEFLRFGSSIPGNYWGCCACCIIQNFKVDPDAKGSIQLVSGDGGGAIVKDGKTLFAGPTFRDIFHQRLRIGTFGGRDMPNHAFIAILTDWQLNSEPGRKWVPILKEAGFEFIRSVSNSVYAGETTVKPGTFGDSSLNHIFMLVRNIGTGAVTNPYKPPKAWSDLPSVVPEAWEFMPATYDGGEGAILPLPVASQKAQLECWEKIGPATFLSEEELIAAGAPVILAGLRSEYHRPQPKASREAIDAARGKTATASLKGPSLPPPEPVPEPEELEDYNEGENEIEYCGDPNCNFCGGSA